MRVFVEVTFVSEDGQNKPLRKVGLDLGVSAPEEYKQVCQNKIWAKVIGRLIKLTVEYMKVECPECDEMNCVVKKEGFEQ